MATHTTSCLVTLTDGKQSKPIKVDISKASVDALIKQGKNKFRKKYKFLIYSEGNQVVRKDDDLLSVLTNHEGNITLLLTDKEPEEGGATKSNEFVVSRKERGISYIIANEDTIEPDAESQLKLAASLEGCIFALGMPDLHPGKGIPIGAVVMTQQNIAYPQLVDNDIGCGVSFVETSFGRDKLSINKLRKIASSLDSIDQPYCTSAEEMMESDYCATPLKWGNRTLDPLPILTPSHHYNNLGTIGGGNHFAELSQFDEVFDVDTIQQKYGIDVNRIHLLVHSGSRGLGSQTLREFCDQAQAAAASAAEQTAGHFGVGTDTPLFQDYLNKHNVALNYAARNRRLIARRLLEQITGDTDPVCKIDIYHNYMEKAELTSLQSLEAMANQGQFPKSFSPHADGADAGIGAKDCCGCGAVGWIHRKGATPTTQSRVLVIPGSRGSLSYLVEVNPEAEHCSGYSLPHGAGRKMNRSKALAKHKHQYPNAKQLLQTELDSVVVCDKKDLIYEEAPASYKDIDDIVKCLSQDIVDQEGHGIVRVLATLRPLLTYKYKDPYN